MQAVSIVSVSLYGIHGHQTIKLDLRPGLNIVYGENGAGKTTFLHTLANLLECDIQRFCYILFDEIVVTTNHGTEIVLKQTVNEPPRSVDVMIDGEVVGTVYADVPVDNVLDADLKQRLGARPVYLPAFRSVLEAAWSFRREYETKHEYSESADSEYGQIVRREREYNGVERYSGPSTMYLRERCDTIGRKTMMCRRWFGRFVPIVRYPSLLEVDRELFYEGNEARMRMSLVDQENWTSVFKQVLELVLGQQPVGTERDPETLLRELQEKLIATDPDSFALPGIQTILNCSAPEDPAANTVFWRVVDVYDRALSMRADASKSVFEKVDTFESSVNRFLEGKQLIVDTKQLDHRRSKQAARIKLAGGQEAGLGVLSSGERQVLTLLFSATHMTSSDGLLLIDEPELSLHVDWQRIILGELMKQAGDRQVIVCTHSPEVAAEHDDEVMIEIKAVPWTPNDEDFSLDDADILGEEV